MTQTASAKRSELLDLFCSRMPDFEECELWLVNVAPHWIPSSLTTFFDRHGESAPTLLDFEDLDEFMLEHGAQYEKRVSKVGGVQLTARGESAHVLARWLSTAFASGIRRR